MTPSDYIKAAWNLIQKDMGTLLGGVILLLFIGRAFPLILMGPAMAGIMYVTLRAVRNEPYQFSDLFKGFDYFVDGLVAYLLVVLIGTVAFLCCVIPAIFLAPFLFYPFAFIVDKKISGVDALSASWNLVKKDYSRHLVLGLLIILLNIFGLMLCCIGFFVTTAIGTIALAVAYNDLVPKEEAPQFDQPMAPTDPT